MSEKLIGIDVGGTSVKGMVISRSGEILFERSAETGELDGGATLSENIIDLICRLIKECGADKSEFKGVGIGCPGLIDSASGTVIFAGNLKLEGYKLAQAVSSGVNLPVKVVNDANAAAYGEAVFGAGKDYFDSVFITLGTGVGGGVIIGGKLFEGFKSAGAELGHMVIAADGLPCSCGRKGCFEAYSSATALIKKTREAMLQNQHSAMWKTYTLQTVNGKTAFEYADSDVAAKGVVAWYEKYLACGITNIANIFRPQVVMIGGGISGQGERLIAPVRELVEKSIFGGNGYAPVKITAATLGNRAGAFGAAALFM